MTVNQVSVIIPAYNESRSIRDVVSHVQQALESHPCEIIVVNDGSTDDTESQAREAGAIVLNHHIHFGYGASLKTGIRKAKYDWIVTIDADGQHEAQDIRRLMDRAGEGYDLVIGARDKQSFQYTSRMPGKRLLQWFAGFLVGIKPVDVNSGLRLFRKTDVMPYFPILPNGFSFSTTLTLAMIKDAFEVGTIPIQTQARQGRRSTVTLQDGLRTFLLIIRIAMLFNPLKVMLPVSGGLFLVGLVYAIFDLVRKWNIPTGAELLILAGIVIFCFGVLADQLASIRRSG